MKSTVKFTAFVCGLVLTVAINGAEPKDYKLAPVVQEFALPVATRELDAGCAMLDDPKIRQRLDGLLYKLLVKCGRQDQMGQVRTDRAKPKANRETATDTLVNDPAGDFSDSQTQSETSLARNEVTGTLCSGFNDSFTAENTNGGIVGFARSTDDGETFVDGGDLSMFTVGDPSIVWRKLDGNFYFASLHASGIGLWRSTDDCGTFEFIGLAHTGFFDDKEILTVDNNPSSPYYGRLHVSYTDFFSDRRIYNTYSADGGASWSIPVALSDNGKIVQGAWPAVAPNGTVYIAWSIFDDDNESIGVEVVRSTDGGETFTQIASPLVDKVRPRDAAATAFCFRPALAGNIRYLASPQLVVAPNGDIAVVYSYDPDGFDVGDTVDVFFRLSTDQGATWEPEIKLNDDATKRDQFFPTLSVGPTGRFVATWYDRRLDENNILLDYYVRHSSDGGQTWFPSRRVTDVSSPIYLDPGLARCYHGDYDQQVQSDAAAYIQWSDDRAIREGRNDPDVYFDKDTIGPDFFVSTETTGAFVCAPDSNQFTVNVLQAEGFTDPVTLSVTGLPAGTSGSFNVNPVSPGGTSELSIDVTGNPEFGDYFVDISGTDGTSVRSAQIDYKLSTAIPAIPVQVAPANGAVDQITMPTLTWNAVPQSTTYTIQIASDPGFLNIVESGPSETTSYDVETNLDFETTYYWRVLSTNVCGSSLNSETFSFTTNRMVCSESGFRILNMNTTSDSVSFSDASIIESLTVDVAMSHRWVGDVTLRLLNETTGTEVELMDRPGHPEVNFGCSSDDMVVEFNDDSNIPVETECNETPPAIAGVINPEGSLSDFAGAAFGGVWTMFATDSTDGSDGVIDRWCVTAVVIDVGIDTDEDGVEDDEDNCQLVANADQRDTNSDGFGNVCDFDFNNDCSTNFLDFSILTNDFLAEGDLDTDINGDGVVNFVDISQFQSRFLSPPGPSGTTDSCGN